MELSPSPIAEAFGLGTPTGPLVAITSGPSAVHRSWRLSTSRGRFAVKAFNRDPHARGVEALEGPVRLELAALTAGVPLPRPCLAVATGAGVAEVAGLGPQPVLVRVHEWVDGTTPTAPASTKLAGELGGILAAIHRVGAPCGEGVQIPRWYRAAHGASHWQRLAACAERAGRGWAGRLRAALPLLAEVEALVAARAAQAVPLVVTHSDLVPGNVLVSAGGRPWVVDWDDAGPWNAAEEVAAAMVSWASHTHGEPDERVALALVEGYRGAGGVLQGHSPTVLAGSLSAVANWLELNLRRSLSQAADQALRWQAEAEVTGALIELPRRLARLDRVDQAAGLTARTAWSRTDRASRLPLQQPMHHRAARSTALGAAGRGRRGDNVA
jgi:Ser/Thr protein kinase RdoA (MazF antagonist)